MKPTIYEITEKFPDGRIFTRRMIVSAPARLPSKPIPAWVWWGVGIFCSLTFFFSLFN
jgi:hypothetical protein